MVSVRGGGSELGINKPPYASSADPGFCVGEILVEFWRPGFLGLDAKKRAHQVEHNLAAG